MKNKRNPEAYAEKSECLEELYTLDNQEHIDLFFGDEAGFSLNLNVPYGWQFPDEQIEILPQRGKQINVLGFMKSSGQSAQLFSKEGSIKADFVIESINLWRASLSRPTVLVLDNARIHHSHLLQACVADWEAANLYIFFLPAYSPHLNRIERLWLKTKQRWLPPSAYVDLASLRSALDSIWSEFGKKYTVNFS